MTSIHEINVMQAEVASGRLDPVRHAQALKALREDGIVVLNGVVAEESIRTLRVRSLEDTRQLTERKDVPFNWTKGNIQQAPPPFAPFLFRDVLVNDVVISVTKGILGPGLKNGFYSGNTALPSESRQPVHADEGQLWPSLVNVPPAHSLVVNIPLVDMGPENGSTEVWPGTHLDPTIAIQGGDIVLMQEKVDERRSICPPLQPVVKAGSVIIRDIRMWHAGMPNRTSNPRPMIAMIHNVSWWTVGKVKFAKGSESFLEHTDLTWCVEYSDESIDHISGVQGYKSEAAT
ncbi:MAG: phytanoyl-CoA dioxygenase family protein [Chlorobia bacterium]|nr:phytanoyl-CoA dioxygenase family protein [Fimbriimonadaceae bacterium]